MFHLVCLTATVGMQEQEDNEQVVREVVHKNKSLQEELTSTRQAFEVRQTCCCKLHHSAC